MVNGSIPRTVLHRAKKALCNRSQFQTLFLPHRFIKIRPAHQRPVSIEILTICRIPGFPKSEQNRKSYGNVRIRRKRATVRRKSHSNLKKSFGMKMVQFLCCDSNSRKEAVPRRILLHPKKSAARLPVPNTSPRLRLWAALFIIVVLAPPVSCSYVGSSSINTMKLKKKYIYIYIYTVESNVSQKMQ